MFMSSNYRSVVILFCFVLTSSAAQVVWSGAHNFYLPYITSEKTDLRAVICFAFLSGIIGSTVAKTTGLFSRFPQRSNYQQHGTKVGLNSFSLTDFQSACISW